MVSNKDRVGGKTVFEIIGVWTCLLETLEQTDAHLKFLGALLISKYFNSIITQETNYFK